MLVHCCHCICQKSQPELLLPVPTPSTCCLAASSEVVVQLLGGLMLCHISAACWWCGPTSDEAALLWGQKLLQLVLPAREVSVKPWCDLCPCCGELEYENGHQQIRGNVT